MDAIIPLQNSWVHILVVVNIYTLSYLADEAHILSIYEHEGNKDQEMDCYIWTFTVALARDWMAVPFDPKVLAVVIDEVQEKEVQKPQMVRIGSVQAVKRFKPVKEGSPSACKLGSHFNP
jgi:hypothetical protein